MKITKSGRCPKGVFGKRVAEILGVIDPDIRFEIQLEKIPLDPTGKTYASPLPEMLKILALDTSLYPDMPHRKGKTIRQKALSTKNLFSSGNTRLEFDFYLPSQNLIVEVDEDQHFTRERLITLAYYPKMTDMGIDGPKWSEHCYRLNKTDEAGKRDWERAYRDAVRDFELYRHKQPFARIGKGGCLGRQPAAPKFLGTACLRKTKFPPSGQRMT